ncbi:MAG: sortase [Chloroflexota bacterium]|nr:sortase [Chloroflexota bacterium]
MIESEIQAGAPSVAANPAAASESVAAVVLQPARPNGSPWLRRLGNGLIAAGLLLMIGVGAYLGIQTYNNSQETQQIQQSHDLVQGLNLGPATAVPTQGAGTAVSSNPPAAAAALAGDKVVVSDAPLTNLNTGTSISSWVGIVKEAKPPLKITIPRIGIDASVVSVGWSMLPGKDGQTSSQWKVAEYAAGHHEGTANPGQVGNVVISGHDDWKGEVFKNLHNVKRGDEIHIFSAEREFLYIVQDSVTVLEDGATDEQRRDNARYMDPTPDQRLTLITCWPYGVDDHRLIVIAKPYDSNQAARPDLIVR